MFHRRDYIRPQTDGRLMTMPEEAGAKPRKPCVNKRDGGDHPSDGTLRAMGAAAPYCLKHGADSAAVFILGDQTGGTIDVVWKPYREALP